MRRDDDFQPKIGGIKDRGGDAGAKIRSFASEVATAARKAGFFGQFDAPLGPYPRGAAKSKRLTKAQGPPR